MMGGDVADFVDIWKQVILTPNEFYKHMSTTGGYIEALRFALVNFIIAGIGFTLVSILKAPFLGGFLSPITIIIFPLLGVASLFINSAIFLVLFVLVGGSGTYEGTFRMLSYASAVNVIFWIPIIGWIAAWIYGTYLMIIGGMHVHQLDLFRSGVAVLLPIIAIILALIAFSFYMMPHSYPAYI
jgi:hypothetical protein